MTGEEISIGCLGVVVWFFWIFFSVPAEAWVVCRLWQWFVVPAWTWAQPLPLVPVIGLCLIVDFLTFHGFGTQTKDERKPVVVIWSVLFKSVAKPAIVLTIGFVLHLITK